MNLAQKLEARAPWIAGVLFAIPVLLSRYPPMTDLALHEAVVGVLRHFGDPKYFPPGLYRLNLGHPNQLFYMLAWPISFAVGTSWAMKIVVAGTEIALYVSAARFARYLGTPQWTALLVGALGYGWMFYWGLLANLVGLAAFMAMLPVVDAFVTAPTRKGGFKTFGALVLLYFAHETSMLAAILMMGLFTLAYPLNVRDVAKRVAPAAAVFGLALLQLAWDQLLRSPVNKKMPIVFQPLSHKLEIIPGVLFAGYEPYIRLLMFSVAMAAIVLFSIERWRERSSVRNMSVREIYHRYRFEVLAGCLTAAYLIFPFTLSGSTLFYHRFFPPAYAILAVVLAPQASGTVWRLPRFATAMVPLGSLLIAWPSFVDSDRVTKDLEAMIDHVAYNSSTVIVDVGPKIEWRLFSQTPMEGHVTAMRGGRSLFDFTRSSIAPAFMNMEYAWEDPYLRMQTKPILIRPEWDLKRFRYVLFHTTNEGLGFIAAEALQPDAVYVAHQGEWFLFESTHPQVGLLAPDEPLPEPRPHTLRKRMKDIVRRMTGQPIPPESAPDLPPGAMEPMTQPGEEPSPEPAPLPAPAAHP